MPKAKTPQKRSLSAADKARFLRAKEGYGNIAAQQIFQWTSRAKRSTTSVASGELHPDVVAVFWISVYGVMTDVREHFVQQRETLASTDEAILRTFGLTKSITSDLDRIIDTIDATCSAFSEDELAYIEYRRHVECHPLQRSYEITVRDGAIIDRPRKLTKRSWTYEEEDAALRRVIRAYGRRHIRGLDEAAIAQVFARRLVPLVKRVDETVEPICRPIAGF